MAEKKFSGWASLELFASDLRIACRQMYKTPVFTTTVVLVLAVGLGVSVAIFSIARKVLLSPLPYNQPDRLVQVVSQWPRTGDQNDWSAPLRDAIDWKTSVPAFQDVAIYRYNLVNLTGSGEPESLYGLRVTGNLLPMLGIRPQLGNWFSSEYERPGNTHVILLSDDLWRRRFHSDPDIVGKTIHLDSEGYEVVGVMPTGFNFPLRLGTTAQLPTDQMQYWMPLTVDLAKEQHGTPNAGVIARLKPGAALGEALAQLQNACGMLQREYPETNRDLSARLSSLRQQTTRQVNAPLLALLAATALILLLACSNIASLLLARGESRASELAVRIALGGSASRVARLPMLQGILLCCLGCLLGLPVAMASMRFLLHLAPVDVPRLANASIDFEAVLFATALALLCGIFVGGLNALQVMNRSPREVLSDASRTSIGRPRTKLRSSLVVSQVALAVILITGAGLLLRTFVNLRSTDIGYRADHVYYGVTVLPPSRYFQFEQRQLFFKQVLDRLRSTPGVEAAAVSTGFPLVGQYDSVKAQSKQSARNAHDLGISADFNAVSTGYLGAMGVRLLRGRFVTETDTAATPKVAVVDENLASGLWPGENPLGQLINTNDPVKPVWRQVVGVVAPMHNRSLDVAARPGIFVPLDQTTGYVNFIVAKTPANSKEASRLLKNTVASVDSNQGVFFIQSLPDLIANTVAVRHFLFVLLAFFGGAALALSTLGIYGLISFIAASRTREVGIRMALGATRGNIGSLIVSQGIRLALLGEGVGILASAALGHLLSSLLYGVRSFDVETILLTVAILGIATTTATLIPAYRSIRVRPMTALRTE
jgi:putative ABC transport system permease protein